MRNERLDQTIAKPNPTKDLLTKALANLKYLFVCNQNTKFVAPDDLDRKIRDSSDFTQYFDELDRKTRE